MTRRTPTGLIPDEALNSAIAILGKTGSGKTTAAKVSVESMLKESRRVCIMDPTGVWWGLRLQADGKKDSGLNVVIVGGGHADVPLTPDAGTQVASMVAGGALPQAIIDLSDFSGGQINKFATAFFEELFRTNRAPLHLILDEADTFAPQNPRPEQARMQGAVDKIARQGRVKVFRPMLITQRPQKMDKSVLAQIGTLVVMKLTLPHDRKAVHEWVKGNAAEDDVLHVLSALPSLPTGSGFLWAPDHEILQRVDFPKPRTFDSSRAPEIGDQVIEPMPLGKLDLAAIRAQLDVASDDLGVKGQQKTAAPDKSQLEAAHRAGFEAGVQHERDRVVQLITGSTGTEAPAEPQRIEVPKTEPKPARVPRPTSTPAGLHPAGAKLLDALAQHAPLRWTWGQVCLLAGLKPSGGHFNAGRKSLRDAGFISEDADLVTLTNAGIKAAGIKLDSKPRSHTEWLDLWCAKLPAPAPDILRCLALSSGSLSINALAESIGKKPTGGHWNGGIAVLRNNRLIEVSGRDLRLADLFRDRAA